LARRTRNPKARVEGRSGNQVTVRHHSHSCVPRVGGAGRLNGDRYKCLWLSNGRENEKQVEDRFAEHLRIRPPCGFDDCNEAFVPGMPAMISEAGLIRRQFCTYLRSQSQPNGMRQIDGDSEADSHRQPRRRSPPFWSAIRTQRTHANNGAVPSRLKAASDVHCC
jgi:hypothetical protein